MNFLRHLRAAWLYLKLSPFIEEAENAWTEEDAATHRSYWNSPTGKLLAIRLNNFAYKSSVHAVTQPTNAQYLCGYAAGVYGLLAAMDSHLPTISPVEAQNHTEESDAPADISELIGAQY